MSSSSSDQTFDAVYRASIDSGSSRADAIRAACGVWVENICAFFCVTISSDRRDRLVTEACKIYDEHRHDKRSHKTSQTAAQDHIKDAIQKYVAKRDAQGKGGSKYSGGRSGGARSGLDDMSDMFDSLPHDGSRASASTRGGYKSSKHKQSEASEMPPRPTRPSAETHDSGRSSKPSYPKGGRSSGRGYKTYESRPRGATAPSSFGFADRNDDSSSRYGARSKPGRSSGRPKQSEPSDTGRYYKPSCPEGGRRHDFNTQEFRPSHSSSPSSGSGDGEYFKPSRSSHGNTPRGFNTQEFRPSGSSSWGFGGFPSSGFPGMSGVFGCSEFPGSSGFPGSPSGFFSGFPGSSGFPNSSSRFYSSSKYGASTPFPPPSPTFDPTDFSGFRPSTDSHFNLSDSDSDPDRRRRGHSHSHRPRGHRQRPSHSHSKSSSSFPLDTGLRPPTCFYKVLDIPRTATDAQIKKAYRAMSLRYHPDRAGGDSGATAKMAEVNQAHDILADAGMRAWYDATGCVKPMGA